MSHPLTLLLVRVTFSAPLWDYTGEASWYFVTLPPELTDDIRAQAGPRRGFGSVRVRATVGGTAWSTSIFPSKSDGYLLPVKKAVRTAEGIDEGDLVAVELELADA